MDPHSRHEKIWRLCYTALNRPICRFFHLEHEDLSLDGPVLVIANHVTDFDPLLLAMSFPRNAIYYVASEHLFRQGLISKLLFWLMEPISRRKGSVGTDTVKACLRHLKDGHTVCIFAEGDASWDGLSGKIFPATGKLARSSGARLVTCRIEGGYLTKPRWSRSIRKGKILVHPIKIYAPDELRSMRPNEITDAIERDIGEDAWERQRAKPVLFRGKKLAENLETAMYLCPKCRKIGTLHSMDDRVFCSCGFSLRYLETGFLDPPQPFETLAEWDRWQRETLCLLPIAEGGSLFSDNAILLAEIDVNHRQKALGKGKLMQYEDRLCFNDRQFPLTGISNMALVQAKRLLLSFDNRYFEFRSRECVNFRKYLVFWNNIKTKV